MTVETSLRLVWEETTPGAWKWLTFRQLCEIADRGRDIGVDGEFFVSVRTEFGSPELKRDRVQHLLIEDQEI